MNISVATKCISSFVNNKNGSIAVMSAVTLAVIVGVAGLAVDYGRVVAAKSAIQSAADSAALKASVLYSRGETQYEQIATQIFNANLGDKGDLQIKSLSVKKGGNNKIQVSVAAELPAYLMSVLGFTTIDFDVISAANIRDDKTVEVALVVDNSRSLAIYGVFDELVTGLKSFRDIMADNVGVGESDLGNLYVSMIPFSGPVNVGPSKTNWLTGYSSAAFSPGKWDGFVMARSNGRDVTDAPPSGSGLFQPFLWPSEVKYNNWAGEKDASKFLNIRYNNNLAKVEYGPNAGCNNPLLSLSNKVTDLSAAISQFEATIATRVGTFPVDAIAWGHRALSSKWRGLWGGPTPSNLPSVDGKKYLVFLTDGEPQWNEIYSDLTNPGHYSAYGWVDQNRLGLTNRRSRAEIVEAMANRFLAACKAARDNGITVITIGYAMNATNAEYMRQCASAPELFYSNVQAKDIKPLFEKIAGEVLTARDKIGDYMVDKPQRQTKKPATWRASLLSGASSLAPYRAAAPWRSRLACGRTLSRLRSLERRELRQRTSGAVALL